MSLQYVSTVVRLSRLYVPFYEKLDNLLDRLDNRRTIHGSRSDALEWVRMDQNNAHYHSTTTLHRLFIPHSSCADSHLTLL
jgi:hypothetical protein